MSGKGDCLDNAVAERFLGRLKRAWTSHCAYATRQAAKADIIADIEMFYNSKRKHSYLGYVSPNEYEKCALVASLCFAVGTPVTERPPHRSRARGATALGSCLES